MEAGSAEEQLARNNLVRSLFIDLIDDDNQFYIDNTRFNDNISGHTIASIQNIVLGATSWNNAIKKTKETAPSISGDEIDKLYNFFDPKK